MLVVVLPLLTLFLKLLNLNLTVMKLQVVTSFFALLKNPFVKLPSTLVTKVQLLLNV